jgi:hypothetical protein
MATAAFGAAPVHMYYIMQPFLYAGALVEGNRMQYCVGMRVGVGYEDVIDFSVQVVSSFDLRLSQLIYQVEDRGTATG